MQVNVKELTGVSHLRLVFMNAFVLQSFLTVSLTRVIIFPNLHVVQTFQVLLPSGVIQVFRLCPFPTPSV